MEDRKGKYKKAIHEVKLSERLTTCAWDVTVGLLYVGDSNHTVVAIAVDPKVRLFLPRQSAVSARARR